MRAVLLGRRHRQDDDGIGLRFRPQLFGRHAVPQHHRPLPLGCAPSSPCGSLMIVCHVVFYARRGFHAALFRDARYRDQHLLASTDEPRRLSGSGVPAPRRASRRCAAHVHGPALCREAARGRRRLHVDRGQLFRGQPCRNHEPARLRIHARRDPRSARGRHAGRWRATRPARRHGGTRLRRRRRRHPGARAGRSSGRIASSASSSIRIVT